MWAAQTYNYAGDKTSWSNDEMTVSADGFYEYYEVSSSGEHYFKIRPNDDDESWTKAMGYTYSEPGFNSTNFSSSGDRGMSPSDNSWSTGGNIKIYTKESITYYILVYYAKTTINATNNPIVCAATYLPDNRSCTTYFVNAQDWTGTISAFEWNTDGNGNGDWPGAAMTSTSKTYNGKTIYSYTNSSWTFDNVIFTNKTAGSYQTSDLTLTATNNGNMYDNTSSSPAWKTLQYDVALDQQSATSAGTTSIIATPGSTKPSIASLPTRTGYNFNGYFSSKSGGGTKYYNADGSAVSGNWPDFASGPTTLYAYWTKKTFTVTVNNDGHGTTSPSGEQSGVTQVDGVAISAEEDDDYEFVNWTIESGTGSFASSTTTNSNRFYPTSTATIQANFRSTATNSLTVVAGSGISSVTGSTDPITLGSSYAITATPLTGYSFSTWTADVPANASFASATSASTNVTVSNGSVTVTASATEDKRTLTPTVDYDHGSSSYTATADNQIGVTTASRIKCSKPNANHYTFAGWTLTNLTVTSGNASTDTIIYVKVNNPANACSAVAKYEEVLEQDTWIIKGGSALGGTAWTTEHALTKASGASTSDIAYATFSIASANTGDSNAAYKFKIVKKGSPDSYFGLDADGQYYLLRAESGTAKTLGDEEDIELRADIAGDYIFKLDYSDPAKPVLTVTFPTTYQVHYYVGTVKGASDDPSAADDESNAISDGDYVLSGTEVTFTAEDAADGYTWAGWYDAATTAGTKLSVGTAQTYTTTVSAATTVYAVYTENLYTVTVSAGDHGSISVPAGGTVSAGADTKPTITASPSTNYAFKWWSNTDGNVTATDWNSASTTVSATAAGTITANFFPQWALAGGDWNDTADDSDALGDWDTWTNGFEGFGTNASSKDTCIVSVTLPANTDFKFKIVDHRTGDWYGNSTSGVFKMNYVDNNGKYWEGHVNSGSDEYQEFGLATAGAGSYKFAWNKTDKKAAVFFPTSYKVTFGYGTGGTSVSASVSGSGAGAIANNQYAASGSNITFSESHSNGYTFKGWYDAASGGSAVATMGKEDHILNSIAADANVYAQYTENMTTVTLANNGHGHVEIGGETVTSTTAGVTTTRSITAVPDAGYYFSGWTITEGTDFHLNGYAEANATATLTGNGDGETSGQTLTANFVELDKIYFRNIFDDGENEPNRWSNVYVYFGITWSGSNVVTNSNAAYKASMTQIGTSDVYWAYVPRTYYTSNNTNVAFANTSYSTSTTFNTGLAASRGDYDQYRMLNMFVPHHQKKETSGGTNYYSNGYWMKYDTRAGQGAGYYLKKYNGTNSYSLDSVFRATNDDATFIQCRIRVDGTEDSNNKYMIVSAAGLNYITDSTITSLRNTKGVSEDTRTLKDNDVYFQVKATSEGFYTFILDQSGDKMKLTVDYPVSPGDYRLKHTYVGRNKANSADSTYITYSDIIKASDAASGATVSMFLSTAGTETLVLQECTSINGTTKLPEWNAGESAGLSGVFTKVETDGDGVYQFDVTVNTSTNKVTTTENIALYDGPFYIKTDCAPGGWANYTRNEMDKNTANPTAFDYYFMKWLDLDADNNEKKNIKCVIANQYNNAISDTLKSDGIATMDGTEPVLDNDGSVRFSYNTKTNTLKRAYLTGAAKLTLETYEAKKIYWPSTSSDQYGSHPGFVDDVVWTYELTVDAKLGAKAGVKAAWTNKAGNDKEEMLIANTNPIISGTGSGTYRMRLVFDFKTNTLISSWTPSGEITDALSDVDVMLVRERQAASDVITFGDGGSLAPRKLVGSLKFEKKNYFGKVASWSETTRPLLTFFVSFPFDVKVSDVFGLNSAYGDAYVIRKYDGAERASKGFFRGDGTTSFWKDLTTEDTMNAYEGYIVVLDNDYFNSDAYSLWGSKSELYLYFPSSKGGTIATGTKTIQVPSHPCTIDRTFDGGKNHKNTDSHWNLIGVPVFTTYDDGGSPESGTPGAVFAETEGAPDAFNYFYEWDSTRNEFAISAAKNYEFKAMHGYMVQYTGDVTFTGSVFTPASVAARRTVEKKNYDIELQVLNSENEMLNRTYVALREEASNEFVLNEDVYLSPNNRDAEIYTFAGDYDVAANRLPVEDQVVRMGLNVHKAGVYTISMPSTFSGTATLVDTYNNTRTNLAIDEYEVNLPKGACDDRFVLELNIHKTPTAIDGVDGGSLKDGKPHKFIMNDRMYILYDGVIYDACGKHVQ